MDLFRIVVDAGPFAWVNFTLYPVLWLSAILVLALGWSRPAWRRTLVILALGSGVSALVVALIGAYYQYHHAAGRLALHSAAQAAGLWPGALTEVYVIAMLGPLAAAWPISLGWGLALAPTPQSPIRPHTLGPALLVAFAALVGMHAMTSVLFTQAHRHFFMAVVRHQADLDSALATLDARMTASWLGVGAALTMAATGLLLSRRVAAASLRPKLQPPGAVSLVRTPGSRGLGSTSK